MEDTALIEHYKALNLKCIICAATPEERGFYSKTYSV